MYFQMKPWNGNERLYFYRQSQQLAGQTGQIGKLRADFYRGGAVRNSVGGGRQLRKIGEQRRFSSENDGKRRQTLEKFSNI